MRVLLLMALFISSSCLATEGFNTLTGPAPSSVSNAMNSVFFLDAVTGSTSQLGTAFVVRTEVEEGGTKVYFLTTAHSLWSVCPKVGLCPNLFLHQNPILEIVPKKNIYSFQTKDFTLQNLEIVKISQNPDLVLLKAIVPQEIAKALKPLGISKSCEVAPGDKLYAVGFPGAYLRTHPAALPIEIPNIVLKRWSEGIFVDELNVKVEKSRELNDLIATSIDSLDGNSGGPILNDQGEVVGVDKASSATYLNRYKYTGQEKPGSMSWSSLAVPCKYLSKFVTPDAL